MTDEKVGSKPATAAFDGRESRAIQPDNVGGEKVRVARRVTRCRTHRTRHTRHERGRSGHQGADAGPARFRLAPNADATIDAAITEQVTLGAKSKDLDTFRKLAQDRRVIPVSRTPADCVEVRVTLTDAERMAYAVAEPEERY
ncbi:hypothetical protein ACFWFQ_37620, partial [Nocardia salmonicida]|uniref:hypothetical protein n=1 Tax=Nocardia salmonicida TaxID=53431 RepID=UPI003655684B